MGHGPNLNDLIHSENTDAHIEMENMAIPTIKIEVSAFSRSPSPPDSDSDDEEFAQEFHRQLNHVIPRSPSPPYIMPRSPPYVTIRPGIFTSLWPDPFVQARMEAMNHLEGIYAQRRTPSQRRTISETFAEIMRTIREQDGAPNERPLAITSEESQETQPEESQETYTDLVPMNVS